jgi:hypothetical protein
VDVCAEDLIKLFLCKQISPSLILAHSFGSDNKYLSYSFNIFYALCISLGGKVCLSYLSKVLGQSSQQGINLKPKDVWIIDSLPGRYSDLSDQKKDESVMKVFDAINKLPRYFPSRDWVISELKDRMGISSSIAQWLGTNVVDVVSPAKVCIHLLLKIVPLQLWRYNTHIFSFMNTF